MKSKVFLFTTRQNDFLRACTTEFALAYNACFVNLFWDHEGQGMGDLGTSQGLAFECPTF